MKTSERRKKILEIFEEKKQLSYNEILDLMSECADTVNILNDIDTLVFFKFLQHTPPGQKRLGLETLLELRPHPRTKTLPKIKGNPKIVSRLKELDMELPPWYRKWAVLTVITREMDAEEISQKVKTQYPDIKWSSVPIDALLKILEDEKLIHAQPQEDTIYTRDAKGEKLLQKPLIQQFFELKKLKDEFTPESRTYEILNVVKEHNKSGISSGKIVQYLQSKYGIRGNKRRAVGITLKKMVFSRLLRVTRGTDKKGGHVYRLGKTTEHLFTNGGDIMHNIKEFKGTVEQFFKKYRTAIKRDIQSNIMAVLLDLEQCKGDLSLRSAGIWADYIVQLSEYLQNTKTAWEDQMVQSIIACILSRCLPSEISLEMLKDFCPSHSASPDEYVYYSGIAREYYFNVIEAYLSVGKYEEALQSFDFLKVLSWESFDFLLLKGRIEMLRCDVRNQNEVKEVLHIYESALQEAKKNHKRREEAYALFYIGLLQYKRGDFDEARAAWDHCLKLETSNSWKIKVYHNLANIYQLSGEFERAKEYYEASIQLTQLPPEVDEYDIISARLRTLRASSLLGVANVLIDSGELDQAEAVLTEIIAEYTEIAPQVVAVAETNMGDLFTRKKDFRRALSHHEKALKLVTMESSPREYGIILTNMGVVLQKMQRWDESLQKFEEAGNLLQNEDSRVRQELELCLADLYCDLGQFDKSLELIHSVLQERWLGNKRQVTKAREIRDKVYIRMKNPQK